MKRVLKNLFVLIVAVAASAASPAQLAFADSLDSLLEEANRALGHSSPDVKESASGEAPANQPARKQSRRSANKQESSSSAQPQAMAPAPPPEPEKPLQPIDAARVSQILSLDLQAQERERVARNRGIQVRMGAGMDWLPPVYETEKDDDIFRIASDTTLTGVAVEATAQIPVELPFAAPAVAGTPFWGLSAGAGYFQGDAMVARKGVVTGDRTYPYQLVSADGGLTAGWNSSGAAAAGVRLWLTAGYGADIIRQNGEGHFDTFSSVFHGATFAVGSAIRSSGNHEIFIQYRQRGSLRPEADGPDRSQIAGRMLTIGLGIPISG